ncbi:MAG TPA: acyltransferase family protein [Anaerolineales bacterium]|nr:acyltransferase family protein [Anaerolineales bacterium]
MSKRIEYLDIARGIGILLVVLGHNDFGAVSPFFEQVIYSFHIPLFFFLSGYFINTSLSFFDYFKKRFHSVLKPYLFTIFLIYFVSVSFEKMGFQTAIVRIAKSLYGTSYYIDWVPLWFLPSLFVVSLYAFVFLTIMNRLRNGWVTWGILLVTLAASLPFLHTFYPFTISVFGREHEFYGLPFSLDLIFLSGFFFILGNEARQMTAEKTFDNIFLLISTGIGLIVLNLLFPYKISFADRVYDSFLVNTAEAILGILFVLALSRQIEIHTARPGRLFKYFGSISLIILLFHLPIQHFWGEKVMTVTNSFPLAILIGFIMGVLGPALIYEIFIRYNPVASYWFGRKAEPSEPKELTAKEEQTVPNPASTPVVEGKEQ